jgi:hypothetical protein
VKTYPYLCIVYLKQQVMEINVENKFSGIGNYVTTNISECVKFWNREGLTAYENNKTGAWGDKSTQERALTTPYDDFVLHMLLCDCQVFCNSKFAKESGDKYECGRTRSHVWVHLNDERIFMFFVK